MPYTSSISWVEYIVQRDYSPGKMEIKIKLHRTYTACIIRTHLLHELVHSLRIELQDLQHAWHLLGRRLRAVLHSLQAVADHHAGVLLGITRTIHSNDESIHMCVCMQEFKVHLKILTLTSIEESISAKTTKKYEIYVQNPQDHKK